MSKPKKITRRQMKKDAHVRIARLLFFDLMDGRDNEVQEALQWEVIDRHLTRGGATRDALGSQEEGEGEP